MNVVGPGYALHCTDGAGVVLRLTRLRLGPRQPAMMRILATIFLLALSVCSFGDGKEVATDKHAQRAQLSIGYSLLYQEADGIPKLKWLLMFKDKPAEMGRLTNDLLDYYRQLAGSMQQLSKQYPAMRIDAVAMSKIEGDTRKAIGEDLAKDFAPLIGKTGVEFERRALLMFSDSLNEQRHLTAVMMELETVPALKKFLGSTNAQLDTRYQKVEKLLERRYFTR